MFLAPALKSLHSLAGEANILYFPPRQEDRWSQNQALGFGESRASEHVKKVKNGILEDGAGIEGGLSLESHHDELGNMGSVSSSSGGRLVVHGVLRPLRCFCLVAFCLYNVVDIYWIWKRLNHGLRPDHLMSSLWKYIWSVLDTGCIYSDKCLSIGRVLSIPGNTTSLCEFGVPEDQKNGQWCKVCTHNVHRQRLKVQGCPVG